MIQEPYVNGIELNLKKVQGQIRLIQKMLADERYCVDIAQQINAAIGILKKVNDLVLESHLNTCAASKLNSKVKTERQEFVKELIHTFKITNT